MLSVCYQDISQDRQVASEALALAGVIRALDGEIYDPASQLTGIVRRAEHRCLLWRFPKNTGSNLEAGLRDEDLSAIWRDVTEKYVTGGGCRLRVLADDLTSDDCTDAVKRLLQSGAAYFDRVANGYGDPDWRYVPSFMIASVTVYLPTAASEHNWQWPMHVFCQDISTIEQDQEPFARELATLSRDPFTLRSPDLLIRSDAISPNTIANEKPSGLVLHVSGPDLSGMSLAPSRVWQVLDRQESVPQRPEAVLSAEQDALPVFLRDYVYTLSHDAPPDVALFDAWFRLSPRPDTPLVLMAPAIGFDADMEYARLSNRLSETIGRLGRLLVSIERSVEPLTINITSRMAQAFALPQSGAETSFTEIYKALLDNMLAGRISFDNESDTGENLNALNAETERLNRAVDDATRPGFSMAQVSLGSLEPLIGGGDEEGDAFGDFEAFEEEASEDESYIGPAACAPAREIFDPRYLELAGSDAPVVPLIEVDRYVDPVFYHDHYASGDELDDAETVPDNEALEEESPYTLEIAIRAQKIGIDRDADAPATLTPRREAQESVTVYARVESLDPDLLTFEDGFLPLTWPFNADSTRACFRCETGRGPRGRNTLDVEVLIYSEELHLLEVMTIRDVVVGDNPDRLTRHKHWPEDRPTALHPGIGEEPVSLSLRIKGAPMGYTAEAIFRIGPDRMRPIPLGRTILADDIRALLVQIRDFWTDLVVGDLSVKEKLLKYKYKKCLDQMWSFGGSAWRLFFGNDRDMGASALGDLIRAVDLPQGSVIQISCREDARHFVFPWALMRPDPVSEGDPDPEEIWGLRFLVEQITRKGSRNLRLSDTPVRIASVIDPGFAGVVPHQDTLDQAVGANGWGTLTPLTTQAEVQASLSGDEPAQLYYFFCQGFTPGENPHLAADHIRTLRDLAAASDGGQVWDTLLNRLSTPPGEAKMFFGTASMTETELNDIDFFQGRSRPIVFLNMCHSADLLPAMGHGMTRRFIERNASAVVGTECPMTAVFADLFAGKLLEELAAQKTIGQAILAARLHFHEARNPLGFAYTLYGRSDARLGPEPLPNFSAILSQLEN